MRDQGQDPEYSARVAREMDFAKMIREERREEALALASEAQTLAESSKRWARASLVCAFLSITLSLASILT